MGHLKAKLGVLGKRLSLAGRVPQPSLGSVLATLSRALVAQQLLEDAHAVTQPPEVTARWPCPSGRRSWKMDRPTAAVIPKVRDIDLFDGGAMASWVGAARSAMQKHRASTATPPGGHCAPPQAACL